VSLPAAGRAGVFATLLRRIVIPGFLPDVLASSEPFKRFGYLLGYIEGFRFLPDVLASSEPFKRFGYLLVIGGREESSERLRCAPFGARCTFRGLILIGGCDGPTKTLKRAITLVVSCTSAVRANHYSCESKFAIRLVYPVKFFVNE